MNFLHLFTSLDGRIGRAKWWVGTLILLVSARLLASIIAGFLAPPTGSILITIVYLALFRPGYAVAAKRFQDRDKPGVTALYGLIPGLVAVLLPVYGLQGSWQQPNTLGWICAFIEWTVSIWFVIELGILKGSAGPNRFDGHRLDVVTKSQALDGSKIIGGRLAAYFAAAAGAVIMVALCNSVVWMISVPQTLSLFALLHSTDRGAEPGMLTTGIVLLLASGFALIWFVLATPFARLALRVWPVDPFGGWTIRNVIILAFGIVCLIPVVAFFFLTFAGVMNW